MGNLMSLIAFYLNYGCDADDATAPRTSCALKILKRSLSFPSRSRTQHLTHHFVVMVKILRSSSPDEGQSADLLPTVRGLCSPCGGAEREHVKHLI